MARRAIGEEPLPEEDPNNPIFKPLVEPSRLDSYLITNQISNYCGQINGYAFLHALSFCSHDNYGNSLFLCPLSALLVRALLRSTQWMRFIRNRLSSEVLILLKILDICFGKVPVFCFRRVCWFQCVFWWKVNYKIWCTRKPFGT